MFLYHKLHRYKKVCLDRANCLIPVMTEKPYQIKSTLLFSILIAVITGTIVTRWLEQWPALTTVVAVGTMLSVLLWICAHAFRRPSLFSLANLYSFFLLLLIAAFVSALRLVTVSTITPSQVVSTRQAGTSLIAGTLVNTPDSSRYSMRFVLDAKAVWIEDGWVAFPHHIQVSVPHSSISTSAFVLVRGRLTRPELPKNPGAFDYSSYLALKGIHLQMNGDSLIQITRPGNFLTFPQHLMNVLRTSIRTAIHRPTTSEPARAALEALILGNQSRVSDETISHFRETGLLHVLAISGLHVLLVGFTVYHGLHPLLARFRLSWTCREWARCVTTSFILIIYMLITGAKASVVRAVLLAGISMYAAALQRHFSPFHALQFAGLLLLLISPAFLFDIGFQLSFSAVLALLLLIPTFKKLVPEIIASIRFARLLLNSCLASLAATLGTLPVLLYHFGYVSFAGLALNTVAIPLTSAILSAGLLLVLFSPISALPADLLGYSVSFLVHLLFSLADVGARYLDMFSFRIPYMSPFIFVLLLASLFWGIVVLFSPYRWRYLVLTLCGYTSYIGFTTHSPLNAPLLEVVYFDVGHGDATLVTLPNRSHLLIDAGGSTPYSSAAQRALLPFLDRHGIETLEAILITHPHLDHYGGLSTLLNKKSVSCILMSEADISSSAMVPLIHEAQLSGTKIINVSAGDTLALDASVRIRVLSPTDHLVHTSSINNGSVVLHIQYGDTSFLFLGDAEQDAEREMIRHFPYHLSSTVLKVGHHGSRTSSSSMILERVRGKHSRFEWALISTGRQSLYGLPDEDVIERLLLAADSVHVTNESRALWLVSDGKTVRSRSW